MPDFELTGKNARTLRAYDLLRNALIAPEGMRRKVDIIQSATTDHPSDPLKAGHSSIRDVYVIDKTAEQETGWIVISPLYGLDINIRTHPIVTSQGSEGRHQTLIDLGADFLAIVTPFVFDHAPHKVEFNKYCFIIRPDERW